MPCWRDYCWGFAPQLLNVPGPRVLACHITSFHKVGWQRIFWPESDCLLFLETGIELEGYVGQPISELKPVGYSFQVKCAIFDERTLDKGRSWELIVLAFGLLGSGRGNHDFTWQSCHQHQPPLRHNLVVARASTFHKKHKIYTTVCQMPIQKNKMLCSMVW